MAYRYWVWLAATLLALGAPALALRRPPAHPAVRLGGAVLALPAEAAQAPGALTAAVAALAARPVVLQAAGGRWRLTLGDLGVAPAPGALAAALAAATAPRPWWRAWLRPSPPVVPLQVDPARLAATLAALWPRPELPALPARLSAPPADAPDDAPVRIDPGRPGWAVDRAALAARLLAAAEAGVAVVDLPLRPVPPQPSAQDLAALGVQRRIARFQSEFDPRIPRAENVARATAALDGLLLPPDDVLSLLATVGPIDPEHGYQQAWVIAGGRLVPGVGGGVCQVASTLYGAALRAGLAVTERHPHSLAVTYLPLSQDAAIAPGLEDLKLRNTTGHYVLLRAQAAGGRVTIAVYGEVPPGQRIEVQSEELATYPPPTVYVRDPRLPAGASEVRDPGAPGHRSVAWRLVYSGDRLLGREQLSLDSYPPEPRVIARDR